MKCEASSSPHAPRECHGRKESSASRVTVAAELTETGRLDEIDEVPQWWKPIASCERFLLIERLAHEPSRPIEERVGQDLCSPAPSTQGRGIIRQLNHGRSIAPRRTDNRIHIGER